MKKRSRHSTSKKSKKVGKKNSQASKHAKVSRDKFGRFKAKPARDNRRYAKGNSQEVANRHKRKHPKPTQRKPVKKAAPKVPKKRIRKRAPPKGYRLERSERFVEPFEIVGYTYRVEALAQLNTKYQGVSFDPEVFNKRKPHEEERTLQVFHTPFVSTELEAFELFEERVNIMRAYGGISFVEITYWKVSGPGPMKEKHWQLLGEYDEPEDVFEEWRG